MSFLDDARAAAIPGYADTQQAIAYLRALRFPAPSTVTDVQRAIIDRIVAGEQPTGRDVLDQLAAAQLGTHPQQAAENMRAAALHDLPSQLDNLTRAHVDDVLTFLNARLAEVLDRAWDVFGALHDVTSAADALKAGRPAIDAWPVFEAAVRDYTELRAAQIQATEAGYGDGSLTAGALFKNARDAVARFGIVRQARQHPPLVDEAAGVGATVEVLVGSGGTTRTVFRDAPWPTDPAAFLRWHFTGDLAVTPWIPTVAQLRAEAAAHTEDKADGELAALGLGTDRASKQARAEADRQRFAAANAHADAQIKSARQMSELHARRIGPPPVNGDGTPFGLNPNFSPTTRR